MSLIFISHSSKDNAQAVALKNWLVDKGWDDLFLDLDPHHGISAGERWKQALIKAAGYCDAVILLISNHWLESDYCMEEYRIAKKLNKQIFPLIIESPLAIELPEEISNDWQFIHLDLGRTFFTQTVTLPDGVQDTVSFSDTGLQALSNGLNKAGLNPESFAWPLQEEYNNPPAPYKGLRPLQAEDAGIFFGRDGAIFDLMAQLRGLRDKAPPRFMVILGASGSGKSSFVRAGILPRLSRDNLHFIVMPIIRPETAVITGTNGLLSALVKLSEDNQLGYTRKSLSLAIDSGQPALVPILNAIIKANTLNLDDKVQMPPTLVMTIDQAEELFQHDGREEAQQFLALLAKLVSDIAINLMVIATIRSDSYGDLQDTSALEGIKQHTFSLPPIAKGAYHQIIEGPAKLLEKTSKALYIEPQLTDRLLKDLEQGGNKDALPLLAFTLERLYQDYSSDGDLLLKEYLTYEEKTADNQIFQSGLGGLKGAVATAVTEALKKARQDPKIPSDNKACLALLRRGFIPWLAGIDPETGKAKRQIALYEEIPDEAKPIIDSLIEARLITKDINAKRQVTVEPTHESILRQWQQLDTWLEEDMHDLSLADMIKSEASAWHANNHDSEWLRMKGGRLQEAERLLTEDKFKGYITEAQTAYLQACRAQENQLIADQRAQAEALNKAQKEAIAKQKQVIKRTRIGLAVSFVLLLLSGGLTIWALENENKAKTQKEIAELNAEEAQKQKEIVSEKVKELENSNRRHKKWLEKTTKENIKYLLIRRDLIMLSKNHHITSSDINSIVGKINEIIADKLKPNYRSKENKIFYRSKIFYLSQQTRQSVDEIFPNLIGLILSAESMDDDERQYWFDIMPSMDDDQIMRLYNILEVEKVSLDDLEDKYETEIKELNEKHSIEWAEFQIKELDKKYNGKVLESAIVKDYLDVYKTLLNAKKINEKKALKKLINIESRFDLNASTDFQSFSIYRQLIEKIILLSANEQKATYQQKLWEFYQDVCSKGYVSKHEVAKKALNLSWTLLNNRAFEKAINVLQKAIKFTPGYSLLEKNIAHTYLLQGEKSKAMEAYKKHFNEHILHNQKTTLWEQLILDDLQTLQATDLLTSNELSRIRSYIDSFILSEDDYETVKNNIESLVEQKEQKTISSIDMLTALRQQQNIILHSANFYTQDMFGLYENIYWRIKEHIEDDKKLDLSKQFLSISRELENKGIISKQELAKKILNVTWYSLFTTDQNEYENAITLYQEAKQLAPDWLMLDTNYAHALALLGEEKKALTLYKSHLGEMLYWSEGEEAGLWENIILKDFEKLAEQGITSSIFDKAKAVVFNKSSSLNNKWPNLDHASISPTSDKTNIAYFNKRTPNLNNKQSDLNHKIIDDFYQLTWIKKSPNLQSFYEKEFTEYLKSNNSTEEQSNKLAYLLATNLSLNLDEKLRVLKKGKKLSHYQVSELLKIFSDEKIKMLESSKKHPSDIIRLIDDAITVFNEISENGN